MKNYTVELIDKAFAKEVIIQNHYLHTCSGSTHEFGIFDHGQMINGHPVLIGVAIYGYPTGRQTTKSITSKMKDGQVMELRRLWIQEHQPQKIKSYFIDQTFDYLKKNTKAKVIVTYSNPDHEDFGQVFQQTNWLYQGTGTMIVKSYIHTINNENLHPKTVFMRYGTIKPAVLTAIDPNYTRTEMKKKHRYIHILHNRDMNRIISNLKHPIIKYPCNNNNCEWA